MKQVDGGLRKLFRQHLKAGFHWQSIETGGTGRGIPDSNYCADGIEGWVEFKQTEGWAVTLSPEQVAWHLQRNKRGGRTHIAIRRKHDGGPFKGLAVDELWIGQGCDVREMKTDGLKAKLLWRVYRGGPSNWDWNSVCAALTGYYYTKFL